MPVDLFGTYQNIGVRTLFSTNQNDRAVFMEDDTWLWRNTASDQIDTSIVPIKDITTGKVRIPHRTTVVQADQVGTGRALTG